MIFALILSHLVKVSSTYGSTIPSLHVGTMNQAPPLVPYPMFWLWCIIYMFWFDLPFEVMLSFLG
jgi:hypothetical protein